MWNIAGFVQAIQSLCSYGRTPDATEIKKEPEKKFPLLDLPEVVIQQICDKLNYEDGMSLRKTCHAFRRYLLYQNCHQNLRKICAYNFLGDMYELWLNKSIFINYHRKGHKTCEISRRPKDSQITIEEDYNTIFREDLQLTLINQKDVLEELRLMIHLSHGTEEHISSLVKLVGICLQSRNTLLKVEKLVIDAWNQEQVLHILQYLDPGYLKSLEIGENLEAHDTTFLIDGIVALKFWPWLEEVTLERKVKNRSIIQLLQVPTTSFEVHSMGIEDMLLVKKTCINSPTFLKCRISFNHTNIFDHLISRFGEPFEDSAQERFNRRFWYFWIPGRHDDIIQLTLTVWTDIYVLEFEKIKWVDVHEEATIQE